MEGSTRSAAADDHTSPTIRHRLPFYRVGSTRVGYGDPVALSDASLAWLRGLDAASTTGCDVELADRLRAAAQLVPAWSEQFTRLLGEPVVTAITCPQIVGVEFPAMAFSRAEWVGGNLQLGLAPLTEDPDQLTYFRIVGAEPRHWDVHGLDGARFDLTISGLNVCVPMVRADIELIRGSY